MLRRLFLFAVISAVSVGLGACANSNFSGVTDIGQAVETGKKVTDAAARGANTVVIFLCQQDKYANLGLSYLSSHPSAVRDGKRYRAELNCTVTGEASAVPTS